MESYNPNIIAKPEPRSNGFRELKILSATSPSLSTLNFVYDSTLDPVKVFCNVPNVLDYLNWIKNLRVAVRVTDVSKLSEDQRMKLYFEAVTGSVIQKAEIRRVFGSNKNPGMNFGKAQPALLILQNDKCVDVYPQRRSLIDKQPRSIEQYLQSAIKELEFSRPEGYIQEAQLALQNGRDRDAILQSMFAIDAFIWLVLWGKKDILLVGPEGRRHPFSSVDFVYGYCRKSEGDFPFPYEFRAMKERNKKLFDELRDSDAFLLKQAMKVGLVESHELDLVRRLRVVRNFCAHFNPYEKTLSQFREAVEALGLDPNTSFSKLDKVSKVVVENAEELVKIWESRIHV